MEISKRIIFITASIILTLVLAFIFLPMGNDIENEKSQNIDYNKLDEVTFTVKTKNVIRGDLIKSISANGLVTAYKELDVVSNIPGFIKDINIYEGKYVSKGDLLVSFDDREYNIAIREAEVNLMNAKIDYGFLRNENAPSIQTEAADSIKNQIRIVDEQFNGGKISETEYHNIMEKLDLSLLFTGAKRDEVLLNKSGMTNALNAMNRANLNLGYTKIKAPFSGVVADFKLVINQRIAAGEKLFKLLDISRLKIEVGVLENEISNIKIGNKVEVMVNALENKIFSGKVVFINPLIDPENKTCRITIEINNSDRNIKPGMFASVNIESKILKDRVLIPKEALLVRDRRDLVFTADGELAKWHYVKIGEQNEKYIEILDGVNVGDKVIVDGNYNLAHDSKINIK